MEYYSQEELAMMNIKLRQSLSISKLSITTTKEHTFLSLVSVLDLNTWTFLHLMQVTIYLRGWNHTMQASLSIFKLIQQVLKCLKTPKMQNFMKLQNHHTRVILGESIQRVTKKTRVWRRSSSLHQHAMIKSMTLHLHAPWKVKNIHLWELNSTLKNKFSNGTITKVTTMNGTLFSSIDTSLIPLSRKQESRAMWQVTSLKSRRWSLKILLFTWLIHTLEMCMYSNDLSHKWKQEFTNTRSK